MTTTTTTADALTTTTADALTTTPADALTTTPADALTTAPALQWATKSGKTRQALTPLAQALAPRSVRLADAQTRTLRGLASGGWSGFIADVRAKLTKKQDVALQTHVRQALTTTTPDGVELAPVDPMKANGAMVRALCHWLTTTESKSLAPYRAVAGAFVDFDKARTDAQSAGLALTVDQWLTPAPADAPADATAPADAPALM